MNDYLPGTGTPPTDYLPGSAVEPLPEEVGESREVEARYETDEFGIKVTALLGEASIVVEHSWDGAEDAATLVNSLPQILINVQEALDKETS